MVRGCWLAWGTGPGQSAKLVVPPRMLESTKATAKLHALETGGPTCVTVEALKQLSRRVQWLWIVLGFDSVSSNLVACGPEMLLAHGCGFELQASVAFLLALRAIGMSRVRSYALMRMFGECKTVIAAGQRCDEHQICLIMIGSTTTKGYCSQLYRLGNCIGFFTAWDKLTTTVLKLAEISPENMIYASADGPEPTSNQEKNRRQLMVTALRYYAEEDFDLERVYTSDPLLVNAKLVLDVANGRAHQT